MTAVKKILRERLFGAKRIAVVGVGSELRKDDSAGMLTAAKFKALSGARDKGPVFKVFMGATAPENFTGQIKRFKPTHIIIIDSINAAKKPGSIILLDPDKICGASFSTHRLPLKILSDYLCKSLDCKVIFMGIQPKSVDFGFTASKEVKKSVNALFGAIKEAAFYVRK